MTDRFSLGYDDTAASTLVLREANTMESLKMMMNNEREREIKAGLSRRMATGPMYSSTPTIRSDLHRSSEGSLLLARMQQQQQQQRLQLEQQEREQQWQQRRIQLGDSTSLTAKLAAISDEKLSSRLCNAEIEAAASHIADNELFHKILLEEAQRKCKQQRQKLLPQPTSLDGFHSSGMIRGATSAHLLTDQGLNAALSPHQPPISEVIASVTASPLGNTGAAEAEKSSCVTHAAEIVAATATLPQARSINVYTALHSRPQRGRKRSNLSPEERQELTRTRNRHHAKSTRYVARFATHKNEC